MIKAVIFDVGGVLVRTHDHGPRRRWEAELGLEPWQSEQIVFDSDHGQRAQAGAIDDAALWAWVGDRLSLSADRLAAFRDAFWSGDVLDEALVDYIRSLRPAYQTAIISNATDNLRQALTSNYPIADAFDLIVCSAEENVMKPDPTIYQRTLQRLDRQPGETVFIDDNADNIAAARDLGMHTVHYRPGADVPAVLAQLGVDPTRNATKEKEDDTR